MLTDDELVKKYGSDKPPEEIQNEITEFNTRITQLRREKQSYRGFSEKFTS